MSETKRKADIFASARTLYTKRKALLEKADRLLEEADQKVRNVCLAIENEEANERVALASETTPKAAPEAAQ